MTKHAKKNTILRVSESQLEDQQRVFNELQGDVGCSKDRISELQQELEEVREILLL